MDGPFKRSKIICRQNDAAFLIMCCATNPAISISKSPLESVVAEEQSSDPKPRNGCVGENSTVYALIGLRQFGLRGSPHAQLWRRLAPHGHHGTTIRLI
jgi:hypothetical protein